MGRCFRLCCVIPVLISGAQRWGGLLFGLGPYAAYTHGWVATIADLIWVGCALLIGLLLVRRVSRWAVCLASFVLTSVALVSKESAVVIPALLTLGWLFSRWERRWIEATVAATIPVAIYLFVRLHVILHGASSGSPYIWHLSLIPKNWIKYQLYPLAIDKFGVAQVRKLVFIVLAWCLLLFSLWRAGKRYFLAYLLVGTAALGPVLIIQPASWYGYGLSAATAGAIALAWPTMKR